MDPHDVLLRVKARAKTIADACKDRKIPEDSLTAFTLLYLALKLMSAPQADELITQGNPGLIIARLLEQADQKAKALEHARSSDPTDPNAPILMTQADLVLLMNSKIGEA